MAKSLENNNDALRAWLHDRVISQASQDAWPSLMEGSWRQLLQTPIEEILPEEAMALAVESCLEPERLTDLVKPWIRVLLPAVVKTLRQDQKPLRRWVPEPTQESLRRLAKGKGLIQEDWIRALFRQEAVEELMADALYRGIRDFSTLLPRLFLSLLPTSRLPGFGGAGAIGKRLKEEFERRIEPELKSFLSGGTQRALGRGAEFAIKHLDDPSSLAMRSDFVDFVLSKAPSFHLQALTEERLKSLEPIVESIAGQVGRLEDSKRVANEVFGLARETLGKGPLEGLLVRMGIGTAPDFRAWASATWPAVRLALSTPEFQSWIDGILKEFLEEQRRVEVKGEP